MQCSTTRQKAVFHSIHAAQCSCCLCVHKCCKTKLVTHSVRAIQCSCCDMCAYGYQDQVCATQRTNDTMQLLYTSRQWLTIRAWDTFGVSGGVVLGAAETPLTSMMAASLAGNLTPKEDTMASRSLILQRYGRRSWLLNQVLLS